MREHKQLTMALDPAKEGAFTSVIATLNVIDQDNDVTLPGAFKDGQAVRVARWGHNWGELPPGKGVLRIDDQVARIDGEFFLDTTHGKDTYVTVKRLEGLQEWSYGYDVLDSELGQYEGKDVRFLKSLDVIEVSPVMKGAGVGTRTESIKGIKAAVAVHHTETSDEAWDGPENEARLPTDAGATALKKAYAWVDPDADPETKAAYKFIHHMVSGDGAVGAANVKACVTGIGILNGGRGGADIPEDDNQGVWSHLAGHLRDADVEPPELRKSALRYADHVALLLAESVAFASRTKDLKALRAKEGRPFPAVANRARLKALTAAIAEGTAALEDLLRDTEGRTDEPKGDLALMRLQQLRDQARTLGLINS